MAYLERKRLQKLQKLQPGRKLTLIFYVEDIQRLLCKDETPSPKICNLEENCFDIIKYILSGIFVGSILHRCLPGIMDSVDIPDQ
jgi:hypothetical protein